MAFPNPEEPGALKEAMILAEAKGAYFLSVDSAGLVRVNAVLLAWGCGAVRPVVWGGCVVCVCAGTEGVVYLVFLFFYF